jgi:hypothetical protein
MDDKAMSGPKVQTVSAGGRHPIASHAGQLNTLGKVTGLDVAISLISPIMESDSKVPVKYKKRDISNTVLVM